MDFLSLPINLVKDGLDRESRISASVTSFIRVLLNTTVGESPADKEFGFLLNNLKFQNFDETNGVVLGESGKFGKKISGSSRNINTFASELKDAIRKYEPRLKDLNVSLTYSQSERFIFVNVRGKLVPTGEDYQFNTKIKVWK